MVDGGKDKVLGKGADEREVKKRKKKEEESLAKQLARIGGEYLFNLNVYDMFIVVVCGLLFLFSYLFLMVKRNKDAAASNGGSSSSVMGKKSKSDFNTPRTPLRENSLAAKSTSNKY